MNGTEKTKPAPLYRRLPHGPNGMNREEVARHQRTRLYGAMIESISERGYSDTTVAHVLALAGVSRRVFYEQFPNKEQCFLATHDILVARERKRVIMAWQRERGWASRLHAVFRTLLHDIAEHPKGPRLVLVDSLGVGAESRVRMQLSGMAFERLLASVLQTAPDATELPTLLSRALVGGIRHVAFTRLLDGREGELPTLTGEVLDWIEGYRSPAASRLAALGSPSRRAVSASPAAFLQSDERRARALGSVVHLTLDGGYAGLSDAQIAQFAGISTEAFHRQFHDKEECYLAVLDEFVGEALCAVRGPLETASSWPEAVDRAMGAFVEHLIAHQPLLRIAFVNLFEVGPGIVGRLTGSVEALIDLVTEAGPAPRRGPLLARDAVTGGIWAVLASSVCNERLLRLPCLVDQLTFIALTPYIGAKGAVAAIAAARRPLRAV
jgi:AcrR family transcriptional regulator